MFDHYFNRFMRTVTPVGRRGLRKSALSVNLLTIVIRYFDFAFQYFCLTTVIRFFYFVFCFYDVDVNFVSLTTVIRYFDCISILYATYNVVVVQFQADHVRREAYNKKMKNKSRARGWLRRMKNNRKQRKPKKPDMLRMFWQTTFNHSPSIKTEHLVHLTIILKQAFVLDFEPRGCCPSRHTQLHKKVHQPNTFPSIHYPLKKIL